MGDGVVAEAGGAVNGQDVPDSSGGDGGVRADEVDLVVREESGHGDAESTQV